MAFLSSLLCSSARLVTLSRLRFWELAVCKRITWLSLSVQRCYTSDTSNPSVDHLRSGLERYKDLQKYFNRRLKATYRKFSNIPDYSVVCGHHHVYFIEGDGIYRMDQRQSEPVPEQVLNLGQVSGQEEKTGLDSEERKQRIQWTVQRIRLSPQEKHLAATLKATHREEPRCVVVRLGKGNSSPLDPPHVVFTKDKVFSLEWATDEVLFYTTLEGLRCSRVFRLDLTSSGSRITSVYEETHPDVFVEVALSRDRQILSINCNSRTSSKVLLIDRTTSHLEAFLVQPRQLDLMYHVEHWRKCLVILTNTGPGQEYQVVQAPLSEPSMVSWAPLFTPGPGTAIKDMDVVGDHCVLVARTPAGELVLIVVPLTRTKEAYTVQDGTLVPVTLFHSLPVEGLSQAPLLVHVYGAYGRDLNMDFCPEKRLLLEQGWALAYCHIRGGGERGLSWQRQASVEGKQRGVEDLQACLHHLFSLGVSSPQLTALTACSAGAVPVAALCNRHPHMMRAVTLQAPFLDVLGTMEDPNLPLTLEDREEWGDPVGNPKHRLTISSYCPLHNVTPQRYPSILLTAYSGDARVPLAGVLKYAEQLKSAIHTHFTMKPKSECEPAPNIVLNIQPGANHLGPEDLELMLEEEALTLAFLYTELGLDPPRPPRKGKR
ncbi:prolyl endopeptidase-like isoform X2 [Perca flavescens]|uniref:prolyl endopeptidase-like isoform X2 n=1 Tax=Perca flavescens TaxID=8167 RepID=UPI00106DF40D|nr:prolyl endopeptidase-like isoform X2 [Perca flavescens]